MALINCPECSKRISDSASNCPNCGFPINPAKEPKPKGQGCFMQTLNAGCLIIVVIFVFALVVGGIATFSKYKKPSKKSQKTELKYK